MKNKYVRLVLAILLCVSLLFCFLSFAGADFGDFGGDGDYGGGGDGGDWDFDWGDSGGGTSVIASDGTTTSTLIMFVILVALLVIFMSRNKKKNNTAGPAPTDTSTLTPIAQYTALDPGFSASELEAKLSNLYVQMQQCWTAKDISSLRPYFTDAYYAQMDRQLDQHRQLHRTNYVERIAVLSSRLLGYRQLGGNDFIVAELQARIVDYTLYDDSGALVSGSKTAEKLMTYEYTLMRPTGQKTVPETESAVTNCPNCGAPVNINRTAQCPFCDSIITVNNQSFVISSIRGISQQTL